MIQHTARVEPSGASAPLYPSSPSARASWSTVILIAAAVVALAFEGGGSSATASSVAGILVWWTIGLGLLFSFWPRERLPRSALFTGALLASFALLVLASMAWAPNAERAFREFDRAALYLGLFVLAVVATRRVDAGTWADGLALGVAAISVIALCGRFVPGLSSVSELPPTLASVTTRLNWPVGYWNGLGILLGLGLPLLLRSASAERSSLGRAIAVVPIPALTAAIYLTSSRGGALVAVIGAAVYVALAARRFAAVQALTSGALGAVGAIAVLQARPEIVDGPLDRSVIEAHGPSAGLLVAGCCVGAGALYLLLAAAAPPKIRLPRPLALAGMLAVIVAAALAIGDPRERFESFKAAPQGSAATDPDVVRSHLLSTSGSGRWQFWTAAMDQFEANPLVGGGAGSYEPWWAEHGSLPYFIRNAHSLWFETLGEFGLIGLLLLSGTLVAGVAAGVSHLTNRSDGERMTIAALVAVVAAFAAGAGIDWVWQLPVVAAVAVVALGLLVRMAPRRLNPVPEPPARVHQRGLGMYAAGLALIAGSWLLVCAQAIPLLVDNELQASRSAAADGNLESALVHARSAQAIQPWAATPYLQHALVLEESGRIGRARAAIAEAISRSESDWRLWIVRARLATKAGAIEDARESLAEARRLNPRSPLLFGASGSQRKG